jgi:hypothetical protein
MSKPKKSTIEVQGTAITVLIAKDEDFISLTDMLKAKDGDFFISDWLRNRNTVEFLGIWESVHNPGFNYGEFATIKSRAGLNSYKISVKDWVEKTNAVGLKASAGRYGGTFAHKDIAFEFGMWISPEFKIYLIKEFQRLKDDENRRLSLAWNLNRTLSKLNYRIRAIRVIRGRLPSPNGAKESHRHFRIPTHPRPAEETPERPAEHRAVGEGAFANQAIQTDIACERKAAQMNATSLSIEPDDLELSPFLVAPTCPSKPWRSWKPGEGGNQRGGLGKAHQLFGDELPSLLNELNEVLSA